MVDVGGGTGAMLASLLRRHPHVRGILVDFPATVARAVEILTSAGVADRVTLHGQSFFDPLPAGADLYLLKSVLNDWPDRADGRHPRRCAQAAKPASRIAVLGGVSPDEAPRSLGIDMLVAGGKTSTITQFTELAKQADLDIAAARTQSSGRYVVECRPQRDRETRMTQEDAEAARARRLVHGQVCYLQMPAVDARPGRRVLRGRLRLADRTPLPGLRVPRPDRPVGAGPPGGRRTPAR